MTEAVRTRSHSIEEQLTVISERQDFLMNKVETLCSSVHQHTELFDLVQQSLAAQ